MDLPEKRLDFRGNYVDRKSVELFRGSHSESQILKKFSKGASYVKVRDLTGEFDFLASKVASRNYFAQSGEICQTFQKLFFITPLCQSKQAKADLLLDPQRKWIFKRLNFAGPLRNPFGKIPRSIPSAKCPPLVE